ncbi:MAG: type II and III secretion system protein family protein, partial [Stenotrophomonas sp.]
GFSFGVFGRGSYTGGGASTIPGTSVSPMSAAFNLLMQFDKAGIGINIGILEGNNLARVLAAPTLVALSGQSANFLSGGEVPVPVPAGTGLVGIQYKPYGIGLTVSPTVLSNDRIVLKVAPEASELDYANTVVISGTSVPSITTRRADTTVELGDGESFVIGGLVSRSTSSGTDKVPLLGDIPVLGVLFK